MKNLISKRIGINDHFPIDKYTKAMFPESEVYEDIIKCRTETEPDKYGKCIKNIYRNDEWIKGWIRHEWNKALGKEKAYYIYNINYEGIDKPTKKWVEDNNEDLLYERANGVMYYDFDHIGKETVEIIRKVFDYVSLKNKVFQWFETSWSGNGCHIRINYDLQYNHKVEWQFIYMYYLDILMREISKNTDASTWLDDNTVDWSCATITRGFAIPYNENGVHENNNFEKCNEIGYKNKSELQILINAYLGYWHKDISNKFMHNIEKGYKCEPRFKNTYNIKNVSVKDVKKQSGVKFDYNWRLKCVTTLMNIYDGDKDKVRNACKYIYNFIEPYKNHTYEEMINNELENKIFANGHMDYCASREIIEDLEHYFGFEIESNLKTNEVYVNDILQSIL